MTNIFNLKSDWVYWAMGVFLGSILAIVVFSSLSFLVQNFNLALNDTLIKPEPVVKFNLEKIKALGI